ncbi:MAG: M23 family metallopeptidase [Candidatus Aenigmatarchaeota archaeon]
MKCKNTYSLPVNPKNIIKPKKNPLLPHKGKLIHAIDFLVPVGTPIYAACGGKVVWVKDDSNVGGKNKKKYWNLGNRIVIKHKNGEYTAYEHLKYRGIVVKVGQRVKRGQLIGYSGNTGYSNYPHLHFEVFNNPSKDKSEGTTLKVIFKEKF